MKKNVNSSCFIFSNTLVCSDAFLHVCFEMKCEQRRMTFKKKFDNSNRGYIKLVNIVLFSVFFGCVFANLKTQEHYILAEILKAHFCWWTPERRIRCNCKTLMNVNLWVWNGKQLSLPASTAFTVMLCQPAVSRSKILPRVMAPESGSI